MSLAKHLIKTNEERKLKQPSGLKMTAQKSYRQETIKNFMPTIRYWAKFYHYQTHQVLEFQDLVMVGIIGLIDALNKYDENKPNKFKTYAEFRIRGEIIDELRKQDWMTRSERSKHKQLREAKKNLTQALGRVPSQEEVANILPFKRHDVDRLEQYEGGETIKPFIDGETIEKKLACESEMEKFEMRSAFEHVIEHLPQNMRIIVQLKYYQDYNFAEISQVVKLSEGRICQLHSEAIEMMKKLIKEEDIIAA